VEAGNFMQNTSYEVMKPVNLDIILYHKCWLLIQS